MENHRYVINFAMKCMHFGTNSRACVSIFQAGYRMAVMHIGAPACGMNAAVRSFVRNCIYRGDTVFGIHDGIEGLIAGNIKQMNW